MSHFFPQQLLLVSSSQAITPPSGMLVVLHGILMNMVANPVTALTNANYIGIVVWAVGLGFAFRQ